MTEADPTAPPRLVRVPVDRLAGWIDRFSQRHGSLEVAPVDDRVVLRAADGAEATVAVPFPPLPAGEDALAALVRHATQPRRLGAVLVRRGGHAVGVFDGAVLVASKVGRGYVQGATRAGGWSQQRYARRRANQAAQAYADAADVVADLLLPQAGALAGIVTGGDRTGVDEVFLDSRLAPLRRLRLPGTLPTGDPRLRVLAAFPEQFRVVTIALNALA